MGEHMNSIVLPHDHGHQHDSGTIKEQLEYIEKFQLAANVFKQVSDSTRLRIFWLLCHREECVINIAALMEMTMPAVSHHLKQLKSEQLIVSRRDGKEVYYKAGNSIMCQHLHIIAEQVMEIACPK